MKTTTVKRKSTGKYFNVAYDVFNRITIVTMVDDLNNATRFQEDQMHTTLIGDKIPIGKIRKLAFLQFVKAIKINPDDLEINTFEMDELQLTFSG